MSAMSRALIFVFCLLFVTSLAFAGTVAGVVVDASGAPVSGASVMVGSRTVTTATDGRFSIPDAPDGEVVVQAMANGFATTTIKVMASDDVRVILQPAPLVDTVVVTAARGAEKLSTEIGRAHV